MPRKKIVEPEEVVEETNETAQPETTETTPEPTIQEKAIDEMFNEQVEQLQPEEKEDKKKEETEEVKKETEEIGTKEEKEKEKKEETKQEPQEKIKEEVKAKDEEKVKQEQQLLQQVGLSKFKNIQDALNAYKELESAFGKAQTIIQSYQRGVIPQEIKEGVEGALNIVSRPRVKFEVPNPQNYNLSDGTFDVASYLQDTLDAYTLSLQKSLVFGELASALYTIMSRAVVDKYSSLDEKIKTEKQAEEIANEIETLFPQLKTDSELSDLYEKAVLGHYQKKGQPLTREEFIEIAKKITGLKQIPQKPKHTIPEVGGFTGQMGSQEKADEPLKSKEEKAVDELFESSVNRSSGIF
ncbi:MAG: hypothetical protein QXO70_01750 [Candidatus Pacearchaeota archaeon]